MSVSYKKLWRLLRNRGMKKRDLEEKANVRHYVVNKLNHGRTVTTETLEKICVTLGCTPNDIMEILPDEEDEK